MGELILLRETSWRTEEGVIDGWGAEFNNGEGSVYVGETKEEALKSLAESFE